jgi:hypothetical protein
VDQNYQALAGGSVAQSKQENQSTETRFWAMKAALLAAVVAAVAGMALHFGSSRSASAGSAAVMSPSATPGLIPTSLSGSQAPSRPISASSLSFPLFFEPNVGQTDRRVKFMARGAGYGLFLTSDEAVLSLQRPETGTQLAAARGGKTRFVTDVVRMHLDGANSSASITGADPLPGRSNYFIGKDRSKWHSGIPQYGRVEYERVYPGVDLVYYGNQQQLEYDFRVAPGADPNRIALSFKGASARIDSGELILSTGDGDIRFRAPHIYQPAGKNDAAVDIAGGFRTLADNKIGFAVGSYDHSRELVIDPVLSYSTFLGLGGESLANIAVDFANNIYLACSTSSAGFPVTAGAIQGNLNGAQNILIAVLNPLAGSGAAQLLFATYLGGSGTDSLGGLAVDPGNASFPNINVYVAGTTTSPDFPTTASAFETTATFTGSQTHGFLSTINAAGSGSGNTFTLKYSTYLAGNGTDAVTGVAVDPYFDAYVTGTTTSTNILTGFPSTSNAYQICPWQPAQSGGTPCPITTGPTQFFASEINTGNTGAQSMLYSTYFGGGYSADATHAAIGGGIAVDVIQNNPHSNVNMYFTGTTNMWGDGVSIPNGAFPFPLINAWQSCLNESGKTGSGTSGCNAPGTNTDAFVVKLNPNQVGATPSYSTFLGGSGNDNGVAIAADSFGNSYVTGSTNSSDWNCVFNANTCSLAPAPYNAYTGTGGATNAFIGKVSNQLGNLFPLIFFAYVGGSGPDAGNAIAVDSVQAAHIAGTTSSTNLNVSDPYQASYGGGASDAFVGSISSTLFTAPTGNYVTYLGGSGLDEGTGIALDINGSAYVAGVTQSSNFPVANPYQAALQGAQNAFASKLGSTSTLVLSAASGSPSPNPLPAGTQGTFTFNITNNGPDPAYNVTLTINVPTSGVQNAPTAEVISSGAGSCTNGFSGQILCNVGSLAVNAVGQVAVFVTPSTPQVNSTIGVSAQAAANGGTNVSNTLGQTANITDFNISATLVTNNVIAGDLVVIDVTLTPNQTLGYNASVTLTQSTSPSMVTNPSPIFTINPVLMSGTSAQQTILDMQTVPRPVNSGSLFRHKAFYATWLPIGGLSLAGLGIGATRKRRRWIVGMLLGLLAGLILLQPACSSGSTPATSGGGTQAGLYQVTITASAGTGASHQAVVAVPVN